MEEIVKHINDTNASYRTMGAGDAKNTDLFLDNAHYEMFKDSGDYITVRYNKENLTKAILFIASILPRKYDNSSVHKDILFSTSFVYNQLSLLKAFFTVDGVEVESRTQKWVPRINVPKKNGEIDKRFYFNNLIENVSYKDEDDVLVTEKFTIRNYLAGGYSDLHIKKADDGIFDIWITNVLEPYNGGRERFYIKKEIVREKTAAAFLREAMKATKNMDNTFSCLQETEKYTKTDVNLHINGFWIGRDTTKPPTRPSDIFKDVIIPYESKEYALNMEITQDGLESKFIPVYNDAYMNRLHIEKDNVKGDYVLYEIKSPTDNSITNYVGDLSPMILYGPPGTGKTHKMQVDYIKLFNDESRFITTFHQSFSYEEFVEGLKPVLNDENKEGDIKYQVVDGVFKQACERAAYIAGYASLNDCINDTYESRKECFEKALFERKIVLLCIDEINRGNVAAIFGDLISLIETSKRLGAKNEMTAILPYSKKQFGVPGNLLIVGTMNTADRSIQLLDSALRRRFKFEELGPDYTVFGNSEVQKAAKAILENMNAKIRCLLNKDNQIGHSYFMHAESYDDIYDALKNKIIPLLEEYFYNDVEKIRFVLSDPKKGDSFYVEDDEANNAYKSYAKDSFDDDNKKFYKLKEDRPQNCEAFLKHMTPAGENKDDVNE